MCWGKHFSIHRAPFFNSEALSIVATKMLSFKPKAISWFPNRLSCWDFAMKTRVPCKILHRTFEVPLFSLQCAFIYSNFEGQIRTTIQQQLLIVLLGKFEFLYFHEDALYPVSCIAEECGEQSFTICGMQEEMVLLGDSDVTSMGDTRHSALYFLVSLL